MSNTDPLFPDRPDHPDLWFISQALIDADAEADRGVRFPDFATGIVDPASVLYVAEQRTGARTHLPPSKTQIITAAWLDGFLAGAQYWRLKATDGQTLKDDERPE